MGGGDTGWASRASGCDGKCRRWSWNSTPCTALFGVKGSSPRALGHLRSEGPSQEETDRRAMDTTSSRRSAAVALPALLCLHWGVTPHHHDPPEALPRGKRWAREGRLRRCPDTAPTGGRQTPAVPWSAPTGDTCTAPPQPGPGGRSRRCRRSQGAPRGAGAGGGRYRGGRAPMARRGRGGRCRNTREVTATRRPPGGERAPANMAGQRR